MDPESSDPSMSATWAWAPDSKDEKQATTDGKQKTIEDVNDGSDLNLCQDKVQDFQDFLMFLSFYL